MAPRRRWVVALGVTGGLIGAVLVGTAGIWVWLSTNSGNAFLSKRVANTVQASGTRFEVGHLRTDLWSYAVIEDLEFSAPNGTADIAVGRAEARLDLTGLLNGDVVLPELRVEGVDLWLYANPDPSDEPFAGLGIDLHAPNVEVDGLQVRYHNTLREETLRVAGASGTLTLNAVDDHIDITDLDVGGLLKVQGASAVFAQGDITYDPAGTHLNQVHVRLPHSELTVNGLASTELDIDIDAAHLNNDDLDALLGNVGLTGSLAGKLALDGPTDALVYTADLSGVDGTTGTIVGGGVLNVQDDPLLWTADLALTDLHVQDLYPDAGDEVELTGRVTIDGRGTAWPDDLVADVTWEGTNHNVYEQHIDDFTGKFHLEAGDVTLEETKLTGLLGELDVTGVVDAVDGPMTLNVSGWITPEGLRKQGIEDINAAGWLEGTVTGNLKDPESATVINGRIRYGPFLYGQDVRFDALIARFQVRQLNTTARGTASIEARDGELYGQQVGGLTIEELSFDFDDSGYEAHGDAALTDMAIPDTATVAAATGNWTTTNRGNAETHAALELGAFDLLTFPGNNGEVNVTMRGQDVHFTVALRDGAREMLRTQGRYGLNSSAVAMNRLVVAPTARATWTSDRAVKFRLVDGGLTDADIALHGNLGQFALNGAVGGSGPLDGTLKIVNFNLDALAELRPDLANGLSGTLNLDMTFAGSGRKPELDGELHIDRLWVEEVTRWLDVHGHFSASDDVLVPELTLGVAGEHLGTISGDIPMHLDFEAPGLNPDGQIDIDIALIPGGYYRIERASPTLSDLPTGRLGGVLEVTGLLADPDFRMAGVTEVDVPGWHYPARVEMELTRSGGAFNGWADVRDGYEARAKLGGFASTRLGEIVRWAVGETEEEPDFDDMSLYVDNMYAQGVFLEFAASSFVASMGLDAEVEGSVVGGFGISGSPNAPDLDAALYWTQASIGQQKLDTASLTIAPFEGGYDVEMDLAFEGAGDFNISGPIPLAVNLREDPETWAAGEMGLQIKGEGIPLLTMTALEPSLQKVDGLFRISGGIRGTPFKPLPALMLGLDGGTMLYPGLGLRLNDMTLSGRVDPRQVNISNFSVMTGPARRRTLGTDLQDLGENTPSLISGSGSATIEDNTVTEVTADIGLEGGAWVSNTQATMLRMDGDIDIDGTWPALQVDGDLNLRSGKVKLDTAAFLDVAPLVPDPMIQIARSNTKQVVTEHDVPLYADFDVRVGLNMNRNLSLDVAMPFVDQLGSLGAAITRADLSSRLGGSTEIRLQGGEPIMSGEVDLLEGKVGILRSRFKLSEGRITFTGHDPYNPLLDVSGEMKVSDASIQLHIAGTPEKPIIDFTSEEIPDQTDILMVLITGQRMDSSTSDDAEGGTGGADTAEALAGLALNSLLAGQSLGNVSVELDGTVRASAPITSSVYATTLLKPLAEDGENSWSVGTEWGIAPRLVMDVGVGDSFSWLDLFWEIRF